MIALAQRLADEGHTLGFVCGRPLAEIVAAAGIDAVTYDPSDWKQAPRTALNPSPRFMSRWYAAQSFKGFAADGIAAASHAVNQFAPDVVVADSISYHAIIAAERANIPWAAIAITLLPLAPRGWSCTMTTAMESIQPELVTRLQEAGVREPRLNFQELISPWLNIAFATDAFAPRSLGSNTWSWMVGPVQWSRPRGDEVPFPWEALRTDRPLVYVSFGGGEALAFSEATIMNIAASLGEAEAQFVFVLHDLMEGTLPARLPGNVIAVRYAPQLALLDRADVVLTHGGYGTVTETLLRAKPMLVMPIGHEQPLQAELVDRAGVGLSLPVDASSSAIGDALRRLLVEPEFRQRAAAVADDYRSRNGIVEAVDHLTALARERVPRLPPVAHASP
jgi:MGT family glycosyltransferase